MIPKFLRSKELADKMKIVPSVIGQEAVPARGKVVTVNQEIDYDTAEEIAMEFDVLWREEVVDAIEELLERG